MAETYRAVYPAVVFGNLKSMAGILNGVGSAKIVRIVRAWILNNQTAAVTGVLVNLEWRLITALSGGTTITPRKMDTNNANVNGNIVIAHGGTATDDAAKILKKLQWSNDEPVVSAATIDEWECLVPLGLFWDAGYRDTNIQRLTLREGQGVHLKCATSTVVGNCDVVIEFTQE